MSKTSRTRNDASCGNMKRNKDDNMFSEETQILYVWDKSSEITNKLELAEYKASATAQRNKIKFYESLILTDVNTHFHKAVTVGDGVFVASDLPSHHYIARVERFYDSGSKINSKFAVVTWFFRQDEIPESMLPSLRFENEIFLCTAKVNGLIDAETIIDMCKIKFSQSSETADCTKNTFCCRRSYDLKHFKEISSKKVEKDETSQSRHMPAKPHVKTTISEKSIWDTLSPTKTNATTSSYITKDIMTSPVSASSIGLLDVSSAALDLLESGSDTSEEDDEPLSVKKPQKKTTSKALLPPQQEDNAKKVTPLRINKNSLNVLPKRRLSVSVKRCEKQPADGKMKREVGQKKSNEKKKDLKEKVAKENAQERTRRSMRLSNKKAVPSEVTQRRKSLRSIPRKKVEASDDEDSDPGDDDETIDRKNEKSSLDKKVDSKLQNIRRSLRLSHKKMPQETKGKKKSLTVVRRKLLPSSDDDNDSQSSDSASEDMDEDAMDDDMVDKDFDGSDDESNSDEDVIEELAKTPSKALKRVKILTPRVSKTRKGDSVTPIIIKTPKNRKPFIPERKTPLRSAATDFDRARENLHVSAVPESLPCREDEFQTIYSFIEGKINSGTGGCMYVSGVPGTGKTATVMEVLSCLRQSVDEGIIDPFDYVEINGMRLTEPHQVYVSVLKQLKGMKVTPDHAAQLLTKHFNLRGKKTTLLLVDELDLLWTKKQDVMYHIFDWPSHRHARLIVIAIANTMDLPERIMMNRVSSRLGLTRLSFLPYNFKQLQEIISSRLHGIPAFEPDAIQLVARKIAAVSGDARRCLDVCRRAIEIADREKRMKQDVKAASIDHVHEALQETFASPMIMLIRNCSVQEKLFLRSIVSEFRRSGLEEATVGLILQHHSTLAKLDGLPPASVTSLIKVCNHLAASRVILLEMGRHDIYARVRLNVSIDDVLFALNADAP